MALRNNTFKRFKRRLTIDTEHNDIFLNTCDIKIFLDTDIKIFLDTDIKIFLDTDIKIFLDTDIKIFLDTDIKIFLNTCDIKIFF